MHGEPERRLRELSVEAVVLQSKSSPYRLLQRREGTRRGEESRHAREDGESSAEDHDQGRQQKGLWVQVQ